MKKVIVTNHVAEERMERMLFIAEHVGWGEVWVKWYNPTTDHMECLTTTGVLLIKSRDEKILVTAYLCSVDKANAVCLSAGKTLVSWIATKIHKNEKIKKKYRYKG